MLIDDKNKKSLGRIS